MNVVPSLTRAIDLTPFERAVDEIDVTAAVPSVIQRLLGLLADPNVSWTRIEAAMALDGALVARVLRIASSAAFAARPVADLASAMRMLGCEELRRVAVTAYFTGRGTPFSRSLWDYSLRIAFTTTALARTVRHRGSADPFLCGLLHDIGTMAFSRIMGPTYEKVGFTPGEDDQVELERASYGFDHTDLGAMVASRWNLFPELELVAQLHHDPLACERIGAPTATRELVELVALARLLGRGEDGPTRALRDAACARVGTSVEAAEACAVAAARQASDLRSSVGS